MDSRGLAGEPQGSQEQPQHQQQQPQEQPKSQEQQQERLQQQLSSHDVCTPLTRGMVINDRWEVVKLMAKGGFGTVFLAWDRVASKSVALKVDTYGIMVPAELLSCPPEDEQRHAVLLDMVSSCQQYEIHKAEVEAYQQLAYIPFPRWPKMYESGLIKRTQESLHTYVVMELLGQPVSRAFSGKRNPANRVVPSRGHFFNTAHSMLSALEALHRVGFLHRDVKPGNFCFSQLLATSTTPPPVSLIDLGFVQRRAKCAAEANGRDSFVGTIDYAASRSLRSMHQGQGDDLESLGYSLLEMWLGDLPWAYESDFSRQYLAQVCTQRRILWASLTASSDSIVPQFLQQWVRYTSGLSPLEDGGHSFLHALLEEARLGCVESDSLPVVLGLPIAQPSQPSLSVTSADRQWREPLQPHARSSSGRSFCGVASCDAGAPTADSGCAWSKASVCTSGTGTSGSVHMPCGNAAIMHALVAQEMSSASGHAAGSPDGGAAGRDKGQGSEERSEERPLKRTRGGSGGRSEEQLLKRLRGVTSQPNWEDEI
ncbi:hypothetical protein FOA52_002914 [Chlamydomonas sp. UWO 241]|nr:hypothetical protein FOA52_002914 [Chlamydomonas sp. UWO 241]